MPTKSDKQPLPVRIGKRTIANLRHHAAEKDLSLGELIRRIFDDWLESRGPQPQPAKGAKK